MCLAGCNRDVQAYTQLFTVDRSRSATVQVARSSSTGVVLSIDIPAGALASSQTDVGNTTITVRPVADSSLMSMSNPVPDTRQGDVGTDALPYAATVLSPAFECVLSADVVQPLALNLTVYGMFDTQIVSNGSIIAYNDVCLGVSVNGTWRCVIDDPSTRDNVTLHQSNQPANVLYGTLSVCSAGTAYAFIYSPLRVVVPPQPSSSDWFKDHWWIIFPILLGLAALAGVCWLYFGYLAGFRRRYKEERAKVADAQQEVHDMELYGTRVQQPDLVLVTNPLAQQAKDIHGTMAKAKHHHQESGDTSQLAATHQTQEATIRAMEEERARLQRILMQEQDALRHRGSSSELLKPQMSHLSVASEAGETEPVPGAPPVPPVPAVPPSIFDAQRPNQRRA